jgi:hypothetical protein
MTLRISKGWSLVKMDEMASRGSADQSLAHGGAASAVSAPASPPPAAAILVGKWLHT